MLFWVSPANAPVVPKEQEPQEIKEQEVKEEVKKSLLDKYMKIDGQHGGQCVEFIQRQLGIFYTYPEFRGVAGSIKQNDTEPQIGGVVITKEGKVGHVALIVDMTETHLIVAESNMRKNDEIIRIGRQIKKDNKYIVGYFNF